MRVTGRASRCWPLTFLLIAMLFSVAHPCDAQVVKPPRDRAGMKGLRAVNLSVWLFDGTDKDVNKNRSDRLKERVQLRLRMAGLTVLEEDDGKPTTGVLSLELDRVLGLELFCQKTTAISLKLDLSQNAVLERGGVFLVPVTWSEKTSDLVFLDEYQDSVFKMTDALVDKFLNEWLKWNPKR